jgi:hypothetical protein
MLDKLILCQFVSQFILGSIWKLFFVLSEHPACGAKKKKSEKSGLRSASS